LSCDEGIMTAEAFINLKILKQIILN
jgi:hypothetical protein